MTSHPVGLVGEQHCREAVARSHVGDPVLIHHEFDNPYDDHALVVWNAMSGKVGYIPRASFLHNAIFNEGKGVFATIKSIGSGKAGFLQIVLEVGLRDGEEEAFRVCQRTYSEAGPRAGKGKADAASIAPAARFGLWRRLFGK